MKNTLALVLLYLVTVSAAPTRKEVECRDQYGHCPEWSKAGYCNKSGYKTYMTLMCSYSCNTCQALKQTKDPGEEDITSASGVEDNQLDNTSDIQETNERDEDTASANEPISGGEMTAEGESESYEANQVGKLRNEHSKDATLESKIRPKQSPKKQQRKNVSEEIKDRQVLTNEQIKQKNVVTPDRDPPGVQEVTFHDDTDDDVNPRSKISTLPKDNHPVTYNTLSKSKSQNRKITKEQDEDVSASGMLDGSGGGVDDEKTTANPKTSDKNTETKEASSESEEMKDIAGDITTGSKIFEADISEPESTSGCSSGFGCFSGNGEKIQSEKSEEEGELEPRSKIAEVPLKDIKIHAVPRIRNHQNTDGTSQNAGNNDEEQVDKSSLEDVASGSGKNQENVIQRNDERATERDDIVGAKSVTNSNSEDSNTESITADKSNENPKVDGQKSVRNPSSGSGAVVNDDIQDQSIQGDDDESIKVAVEGNTFYGSGTDENDKSKTAKEVPNVTKSDAENTKVNEQGTTATSGSPDEDQSVAKGIEKHEQKDGKKENMKDATDEENDEENEGVNKEEEEMKDTTGKSEPPNDHQSVAKGDAENKEINGQKEDIENNSSGPVTESKDSTPSIDESPDDEASIDKNKSRAQQQPADTEVSDIEDALFSKEDVTNEDDESGVGSGEPENNNEDLSSPKARQRIISMEQLIKDEKPTVEKAKDVPAKTRENVPQAEKSQEDFNDSDLGKGKKVELVLDQHYYKPYSNEDSMAYEMLALDLKKEVERAVGNQAIVSQISFSEIRKPGKLPRYSRVLAKFMLHGNRKSLHNAVRKGMVGDMMVEKHFFRSS